MNIYSKYSASHRHNSTDGSTMTRRRMRTTFFYCTFLRRHVV